MTKRNRPEEINPAVLLSIGTILKCKKGHDWVFTHYSVQKNGHTVLNFTRTETIYHHHKPRRQSLASVTMLVSEFPDIRRVGELANGEDFRIYGEPVIRESDG